MRLITGMDRMARESGAEFALIRLGGARFGQVAPRLGFDEGVLKSIRKQGVRIIDVRAARGTALPFDEHPAVDWHAQVAALLANDAALRHLSSLAPSARY